MSHQYYSCRSWFLGQKSAHPKAKQAKKPHFPAPFRGKLSLLPCQSAIYNCNIRKRLKCSIIGFVALSCRLVPAPEGLLRTSTLAVSPAAADLPERSGQLGFGSFVR